MCLLWSTSYSGPPQEDTLDGTLEGRLIEWLVSVCKSCHESMHQLSSPFSKKEIKKFLREKTLIKNFFKYKKGVSHYHFGAKAHSEMIVYTFLLPCKNEKDE